MVTNIGTVTIGEVHRFAEACTRRTQGKATKSRDLMSTTGTFGSRVFGGGGEAGTV
jgi:hypothetical protein